MFSANTTLVLAILLTVGWASLRAFSIIRLRASFKKIIEMFKKEEPSEDDVFTETEIPEEMRELNPTCDIHTREVLLCNDKDCYPANSRYER